MKDAGQVTRWVGPDGKQAEYPRVNQSIQIS